MKYLPKHVQGSAGIHYSQGKVGSHLSSAQYAAILAALL